MPQRNSRKTYLEHGYYHIYNRGVEKRNIFDSEQDYKVFLTYLREYLSPPILDTSSNDIHTNEKRYQIKCYTNVIQLGAYVLMPNHFHLLIRQENIDAMQEFLQSLSTRYTVYFNKRYDRVGSLFQGRYKAVTVKTDEQLVHLSRYIHLNPIDLDKSVTSLEDFRYSSYPGYLGKRHQSWLNKNIVLDLFRGNANRTPERFYRQFVEGEDNKQSEIIKHLIID
ncbi:MAG: transposase [Patescibacteria group bacterium]